MNGCERDTGAPGKLARRDGFAALEFAHHFPAFFFSRLLPENEPFFRDLFADCFTPPSRILYVEPFGLFQEITEEIAHAFCFEARTVFTRAFQERG